MTRPAAEAAGWLPGLRAWVVGGAWLMLPAAIGGCGDGAAPNPPSAPTSGERPAAESREEPDRNPAPAAAEAQGSVIVRRWLAALREAGEDETSQHAAEIRSQAADAIDAVGPDAVPALAAALRQDPAWHVREFAAFALGRQGRHAVAAATALLAGLRDENFLVTEACDGTLGSLADTGPESLAAVAAGLDSDDAAIRGAVAELLGAVGPRAAAVLPRLRSLQAGDLDASVRAAATEAVAAIAGQ